MKDIVTCHLYQCHGPDAERALSEWPVGSIVLIPSHLTFYGPGALLKLPKNHLTLLLVHIKL